MLLGDEFFLAAHDDLGGKLRLHRVNLGLGLAGALLGELVLTERIAVKRGHLWVSDTRPPEDVLSHSVLSHLMNEDDVSSVTPWLRYLAADAYDQVGTRLVHSGHAHRRQARRLLRTVTVFDLVDPNTAAGPVARLSSRLHARHPLSLLDATLIGLMAATGLEKEVTRDAPVPAHRLIPDLVGRLPPPLRELVAATETAVGDAVLSHRR
ncbi:Golgi phosphoprotein 3 GPP34 [Herbihabitans rhizosphaerae]|uniref:Golgi phosphoprotein 3 GPP34 n=1 Tax=Herbihabitans rhizosphaerae TaxID=1872711 RepID=A0A4Q7KC36_9PSEU|nr:GPP34 family phosphoprotein [Herbihabitans rhizosphaerae]RZS30538.1 Golgi phosphoprotein 3 GPP34 [Herbihabitans rhizosphaerae]